MKKICLLCLLFFSLLLGACSPDYSYSDAESSKQETDKQRIDLLETTFHSGYYESIGESGLQELFGNSPIKCLCGPNGSLLYANISTQMIFTYATEQHVWNYMAYDKLTGNFSYACRDVLCGHDNCLFSTDKKIYSGGKHLFFVPQFGSGEIYMSDLSGVNPQKISVPMDAELLSETDQGLYWCKAELENQKVFYSLWRYEYSTNNSVRLTKPAENVIFQVVGDTVYVHDMESLTLYRLSSDFTQRTEVANDVIYLSNFGGELYDYDYHTGVLKKLVDGKMTAVATIPSVCDYWVSDGYVYYCFNDSAQIKAAKDDSELYEYLSKYNQTCGNVYRIKEGEDTPELVYHGTHDGKPDLIDNIFADGEVLYIQYRDYQSFDNNFSKERGEKGLVIFDVTTGESIEIINTNS